MPHGPAGRSEPRPDPTAPDGAVAREDEAAIAAWLVARLAEILDSDPGQIDVRDAFDSFGLASSEAVGLSGELGDWLGRELSPTLAWEYPSIEELARYLAAPDESPAAARLTEGEPVAPEPIAIVGIGCRFPDADGPDAFWTLLRDGVDAIGEIPSNRPHLAAACDADASVPGTTRARWGGFLRDVDRFDARFFGIAPREAARMDPQQRLLLEVAWEALEDAGMPPDRLAGSRTGVFVGIASNDYGQLQLSDPALIDPYVGSGNALSIAANRLSYVFDLTGPSLAIDTACSSSLVAVHLACRSLLDGESTAALAGGVNLILTPGITINFDQAGAMASDGRCKTFDARADGYVRGEGAGVVVLKRLSTALADRDRIHAVILGSAVNQDGRSNGLMAPNPRSQEAVLTEAYRGAGVSPGAVQYVEAHGTGTLLGDPIEVGALGSVVARDRPAGSSCAIGSVKTNVGHLEAAAGIAGLIKVALALSHQSLPPSLHFEQPNPHIPFDRLPVRVQTALAPWPAHDGPALAGVSSFGFGGTNAHVVLQQAPAVEVQDESAAPAPETCLLPLSARDPAALRTLAAAYRDFLLTAPGSRLPLAAIVATASVRRSHHDERLAVVGGTHAELAEQLDAFLAGEERPGVTSGRRDPARRHRVVFVFSGHGSQWLGMGRELLATEPVFRRALEECDRALGRHLDWSLFDQLQADDAAWLERVERVQPALFALEVALAALWRSWGIEPDAVVGHSMGEIAAAYVAGALTLEDAARVIAERSRLLGRTSGRGKTATFALSATDAGALLTGYDGRVVIAAHNSPASTVLSGDGDAIDDILTAATAAGAFCRAVRTDVAFHSPQMDPLSPELVEALAGIQPRLPAVPIYSTVTGAATQGRQFDAAYWGRNLRRPVLFAEAVERLISKEYDVFVEVSPHPVLHSAVEETLAHWERPGRVLATLRRGAGERAGLLGSAGALYTLGLPLDWTALHPDPGSPVVLPRYPWQRERHWFEPAFGPRDAGRAARPGGDAEAGHPLLGRRLATAHPTWEVALDPRRLPDLAASRLGGAPVLPAAAIIEMALASSGEPARAMTRLSDLVVHAPLLLADGASRIAQLVHLPGIPGMPGAGGDVRFELFASTPGSADGERWTLCATGRLARIAGDESGEPARLDPAALYARCSGEVAADAFLRALPATGVDSRDLRYEIAGVWRRDGEALLELRRQEDDPAGASRPWADPLALELAARALLAAAPDVPAGRLTAVASARIRRRMPATLLVHARAMPQPGGRTTELTGDVLILDPEGVPVAELLGVRFAPAAETPDIPARLTRDALLALAPDVRSGPVVGHFRAELSRVLGTPVERIEADRPLDTFGLDSMMALQLKGRIERDFGVTLSVMELLLGPTLEELAALVLEQLAAGADRGDAAAVTVDGRGAAGHRPGQPDLERELARLEQLSDAELEALLAELTTEEEGQP